MSMPIGSAAARARERLHHGGEQHRRRFVGGCLGRHRQVHVVGELRLVGAATTDLHAARSPLDTGVPSGSVTAVWLLFQPTTSAPGAVPYWKPRASRADSSLAV